MNWVRLAGRVMPLVLIAATASGCASTRERRAETVARRTEAAGLACAGVASGDVAPGLGGLRAVRSAQLVRPARTRSALEGAEIVVALDGRSFIEVSRFVECRAATARVVADSTDPLSVAGSVVRVVRVVRVVHDVGEVAVIQIRSRRPDAVREIDRRVRLAYPDHEIAPPYGATELTDVPMPGGCRAHGRARSAPINPPSVGPGGRGSPLGL